MANSVDPNQKEQSDQDLHCLLRNLCPKYLGISQQLTSLHVALSSVRVYLNKMKNLQQGSIVFLLPVCSSIEIPDKTAQMLTLTLMVAAFCH